jgi:hypothetical protein
LVKRCLPPVIWTIFGLPRIMWRFCLLISLIEYVDLKFHISDNMAWPMRVVNPNSLTFQGLNDGILSQYIPLEEFSHYSGNRKKFITWSEIKTRPHYKGINTY